MFESSFQLLAERPVTIVPFLFALWGAHRVLQPHWDRIQQHILYGVIGLTVPIFVALFFAEFTAHPIAHWIADTVIFAVAGLLHWGFRFVDALMAAWLQMFLLFLAGVFFVVEETAADAVPAVTETSF